MTSIHPMHAKIIQIPRATLPYTDTLIDLLPHICFITSPRMIGC